MLYNYVRYEKRYAIRQKEVLHFVEVYAILLMYTHFCTLIDTEILCV